MKQKNNFYYYRTKGDKIIIMQYIKEKGEITRKYIRTLPKAENVLNLLNWVNKMSCQDINEESLSKSPKENYFSDG